MSETLLSILVLASIFALGFALGYITGRNKKGGPFDGMSF